MDENIKGSEVVRSLPKQTTHVSHLAHVGLQGQAAAASGFNRRDHLLSQIGVLDKVDRNRRPFPAQALGNGAPDAARGARHNHYFPRETIYRVAILGDSGSPDLMGDRMQTGRSWRIVRLKVLFCIVSRRTDQGPLCRLPARWA